MKNLWWLALTAGVAAVCLWAAATDPAPSLASPRYEYATLRWDGPENTHVIHPSGKVERLGRQLMGIRKPEPADERAFYMNLAANALGREGYELVALTPDDYLFRRPVSR